MREWLSVFYAILKDVWVRRMRVCPPISHPRGWLCSLPWHARMYVRCEIGKELTVRVSHSNLLCALLFLKFMGSFFYPCGRFHFFGKQTCKIVRTTVKWLQIVALQNVSHQKCDRFFAFAKLPNHWLFGIAR